MKYLIVGLGNIGVDYHETRHNIGFMALDAYAKEFASTSFIQDRYGYLAQVSYKGRTTYLMKPTTYMNLSGKALRYWMNHLKIPLENVLVVTDDLALPFGKLRTKKKGSSGGHNGLKNIEELLGSPIYNRLRFGIGDNYNKGKQAEYVLGQFSELEKEGLAIEVLPKFVAAFKAFTTIGIDRMMNQFNG